VKSTPRRLRWFLNFFPLDHDVDVIDADGKTVARVTRTLYFRRKPARAES